MPMTTVHVVCAYAGGRGFDKSVQSLIARPQWSETLGSASVVSTKSAISAPSDVGSPIFRVRAAIDVYVVVAPTPDPINGARIPIPAGEERDIIVEPGDRIVWTPQ